jgi:hypothetical protein
MDPDLYDLNLFFLQKAREWLMSGQDHKAQVLLGISPEAASLLKRVPLSRLRDLASSNVLCFTLRVPPQLWRDLAQEDAERPLPESLRWQVLAATVAAGGEHVDLAP